MMQVTSADLPSDPQHPQPPAPPPGSRGPKLLFGTVILLVVMAISVSATVLFMRLQSSEAGDASPTPEKQVAPTIASASDDGPVSIITEDPSCALWTPIYNTLASKEKNGWENEIPLLPLRNGPQLSGGSLKPSGPRCVTRPTKQQDWPSRRRTG
jgi:hypothetical protein